MKINDIDYHFSKLNARKQFHVIRRLTPVLSDIAPMFKALKGDVNQLGEGEKIDAGLEVIELIGVALGKLSDADADFILDNLLDTVSRDNGNGLGYSPIRVNGVDMFANVIDMPTQLILAFHAIKANFADFIPAIRSIFGQVKVTETLNT